MNVSFKVVIKAGAICMVLLQAVLPNNIPYVIRYTLQLTSILQKKFFVAHKDNVQMATATVRGLSYYSEKRQLRALRANQVERSRC